MEPVVREASPADAAALVRLRVAMFAAMGRDVGGEDAPWRSAAEHWFAQHLGRDAVAFVVDGPGEGPVASALAVLLPRAPGPADPATASAHVSQVSTLPEHRRRGLARACLTALLAHLEERGVTRSDLHATADGEALYRSLGYEESPYPALRRQAATPR